MTLYNLIYEPKYCVQMPFL